MCRRKRLSSAEGGGYEEKRSAVNDLKGAFGLNFFSIRKSGVLRIQCEGEASLLFCVGAI